MSSKKYRVKVERSFQRYRAGDVMLVEAAPEIENYIKSRLLTVLAIEQPGKPKKAKASKAKTKAKANADV